MIRSFEALYHNDPGFRADHVLAMRTSLPLPKYADFSRRTSFYNEVLARVGGLPGVVSAGYTTWVPLTNEGGASSIRLEGHPDPAPGHELIPNVRLISYGYIRTLGMKLIDGRLLDERDGTDTQPVALINQTMARNYWPGKIPSASGFTKATIRIGRGFRSSESSATFTRSRLTGRRGPRCTCPTCSSLRSSRTFSARSI